jgi:hypothetical protein
MACEKRRNTGSCVHDQCPYPYNNPYGYECIEIVNGFCEVGLDCYEPCPYSYDESRYSEATQAFACKYPI